MENIVLVADYEDKKDLTFFTNEEGQKLEDRFKRTLKDVKYFDILVGYFRTSGFYKLYKDFENIEKIRILVGLNADKKAVETIQTAKQMPINFESHTNAKEISSETFVEEVYASDDNYDVEHGIYKFIEHLRSGKLEIKAYPSYNIHAKVYISRFKEDDRDFGRVITGSSNFSESGLNAQYEFNVELKNAADVKYALNKFEELWENAVDLSDVYIDTIREKTWLNDTITPYELYLKFLYEYFKENLRKKDALDIQLPKGFMKLEYQHEAVRTLSDIVEAYNGAFIADVVGLGKTYIAAMYMQTLPGKKLIICPPPIIESWQDAISDFGVRSATVVSLGKLEHIKRKGYDEYQYVFVDEAHRFRNENTEQYRLLHEICYGKKVILITATPLNNSIYDFYPLIRLFQPANDSTIPGVKNLEEFFRKIRIELDKIDKSTPEYLEEVKRVSKVVRDRVLHPILIRRTRNDIKEYFKQDIADQNLTFPEVDTPHKIIYEFDKKTDAILNETIKKIKEDCEYVRYKPGNNLKDEYKINDFAKTQERNLAGFMKSMLIKRLESSKYAFLQTIDRFIQSYDAFIKMYESGTVYISKKIDIYDYLDNDDETELLKELEKDSKSKTYTKDKFEPDFIDKLHSDLGILHWIKDNWQQVPTDFKKDKFLKVLRTDNQLKNKKIIIFTESMETGLDLYNTLEKEYGDKVLFYSSGVCRYNGKSAGKNYVKELIHQNYDPKYSAPRDDIKILITTDVLAEGINLHRSNTILNYDLPWNPTKVLQRVGRVNRIGTKFDKILIYNFFPTSTSDKELGLENSIKAKIQAFHDTLGEDAKYLTDEEETTNHKLFGENFYNKLNNKDTYNDEGETENIQLKYISILENIRENNLDLFNRIKYLPKKARTARKYTVENPSLITFFKKGALNKIIISDGKKYEDLPFEDAVKYFECLPDTVKQTITKQYYDLLDFNKQQFIQNDIAEETVTKRGGSSNHKTVKLRIEYAIKEGRLTDVQEDYLKKVLDLYNAGVVLNETSKKIKNEIAKTTDSQDVYNSVKKNIPETYFTNTRVKEKPSESVREVILSEMLLL